MRLFYLFYENGVFIWDLVILYESLSWNTSSSSISGILSDNFFWFYHCCVIIYFVLFSLSSLLLLFLFFIAVTCYLSSSVSSISYFRSLLFSHFLLTISHHFLWFCSCFSILISCIFVVFIHSSSFFYNMFGFICSFLYVFLCCRRWCFRYDHFYMIFLVRYFKWCVFGLFTVTRYFFFIFRFGFVSCILMFKLDPDIYRKVLLLCSCSKIATIFRGRFTVQMSNVGKL